MAEINNNFGPKEGQLEAVRDKLLSKHVDEEIEYATCCQNGCFDMCLLKCHKKDGILTAIETDNVIHPNVGREDEYYDEDEFYSAMFQHRACVRGRGWRKDVYSPNRIKYPMKAVGGKGSRKFKRISWDQALDEIAQRYVETREKYGPMCCYAEGMMSGSMDYLGQFMPGGALSVWGCDSFEPHDFADTYQFGRPLIIDMDLRKYGGGTEAQSFLDTKAVVLFGVDIYLNYPEHAYYLNMARSKGIPVIVIDPRYTWTAHLADQWIPIRPSTDGALIEAMAHTIFTEGLEDKEFIEKHVEPGGIDRWKDILFGDYDGQEKTPEWAERITGIPAETIRDLARLCAQSPTYIRMVWAATRNIGGEDPARLDNYLRIITGNLGKRGCVGTGMDFGVQKQFPFPPQYLYGERFDKIEEHNNLERENWFRAVLERERLEAGEITLDMYKQICGCPADEIEPNIKMIFMLTNPCNLAGNYYDAGARIKALKMVPTVVYAAYSWVQMSTWYADYVLPLSHQFFEGGGGVSLLLQHYSINNGLSPVTSNYFIGMGKVLDPPGECRTKLWIMKELAERIQIPGDPDGACIADYYCPEIKGMAWEDMDDFMEKKQAELWDDWCTWPEIAPLNPPTWDEFKKLPYFIRPEEEDKYYIALRDEVEGKKPWDTPSGKIEIVSHFVEDHDYHRLPFHTKTYGKGEVQPVGRYVPIEISPLAPKVNEYPLFLVTPHSFYKQHFCQDENPWFRDEYRNTIWISAADAAKRGISDGDTVFVYNDFGQVMVEAYVTSRITPGIACLIFGRQYDPSSVKTELMPDGICRAGSANFLCNSNEYNHRTGIDLCFGMVEVASLEAKGTASIICEGVE